MAALSEAERTFNEGTSGEYSFTLKDESEVALTLAQLTSLTLTLYDPTTLEIVNNRSDQNVRNANDVTVSAACAVTWEIQDADTMLLSDDLSPGDTECHIALFEWTWSSGRRSGRHTVRLIITAMDKVSVSSS